MTYPCCNSIPFSTWSSSYFCFIFACRYILNYLRTGRLIYPKENKVLAKELYLEAEFYQISGVRNDIWPGGAFQNSSYIINSLSDEQRNALLSLIPPQDIFVNWVQLYSSQIYGWCTSSFHQYCNNKGPTVVIARAGNNIFGGYAEVSWNSGNNCTKFTVSWFETWNISFTLFWRCRASTTKNYLSRAGFEFAYSGFWTAAFYPLSYQINGEDSYDIKYNWIPVRPSRQTLSRRKYFVRLNWTRITTNPPLTR